MSTDSRSRKLTIADIADMRAYEREREALRARVIDLKSRRRISLGHIVTVMFENRDTMRHQVQEMARVEKIVTDEGIQDELDAYNPMIPEPGQLCATVFIELTSEEQMRLWLPRLVGIERSFVVRLPGGGEVRSITEEQHESQLTRPDVTAAVHYVRFEFTPEQVDGFVEGVVLASDHPAYAEEIELLPATIAELRTDLLPDPA
ncbi:MAG: DUF3501 family protein [Acidimicrobiales bacterium]|nr:DUF3501 family protein [Acidimicrobiales bacterium]MCB9394406.1 DUF3501 family protein [Acidimicrobiaceae bacterium]